MAMEEGDVIRPAGPPHTYFGVAQEMMPAVRLLANASPPASPLALCLVAAHVLECLLKAYLSRDGDDARLTKKAGRHDLNGLWKLAFLRRTACIGLTSRLG